MKNIFEKIIGKITIQGGAPEFPSGRTWEPGEVKLVIDELADTRLSCLGEVTRRASLLVTNKNTGTGKAGLILGIRARDGRVQVFPRRTLGNNEWEVVKAATAVFLDALRDKRLAERIKTLLLSSEEPEKPTDPF